MAKKTSKNNKKKITKTKDNNISKNKKNIQEKKSNEKKFNNTYEQSLENSNKNSLEYKNRLLINSLCILVLLSLSVLFVIKSISITNKQKINYKENSNLDYKVYLKENSFYDVDYLEKDMSYIANLIDRIDVDFEYLFQIDTSSSIDFNYDIIGKLIISDSNSEKVLFQKEYTLLNNVQEKMKDDKKHTIKKSVSIDYDYYNNLANRFKASYGVNTTSNLVIYLRINKHNSNSNTFDLDNNSQMSLSIPLSEKVVNIKLDYNEINESNNITDSPRVAISNYTYFTIGIIFIILTILYLIRLIKLLSLLMNKKSNYDKYVKRILNEYDRLIVSTTTPPNTINTRIIKIDRFEELLDVRDNLKLPIKYFVVVDHQECNFYINHDNELYLLTIKEIDLKDQKR